MEKELITIIIPVYNVEKYIHKCIDSVINQTYKNLEIILVDDGSPDNCGKICDEYAKVDKRIKVIHQKNGGLSDARNSGIDIAKGEFISFVDSDDYINEDCIEILYKAIIENDADMSIGAHTVKYSTGKNINKATGEITTLSPEKVLERMLYDDGIDLSAWAKLYKIDLFKEIRYPKGRLFEDAATTYKLIDKSKKISIISISIYNYIIRNNSISSYKYNHQKMDLVTSTTEMCEYIRKKYPQLEKACNRREMYAYLSTISQLAKSKEKFQEDQKVLTRYIMKNKRKILKDKRVPKRDKLGIISLSFGFTFYKAMWNTYAKITGRE